MTSPETSVSEAEVEAAALAIRAERLRPMPNRLETEEEYEARIARAAITAAAQVRAQALGNSDVTEFEQAQSEAYVAAVYAMNRYRNAFEGRPVRDMTEAECAWQTAHERLERMVGYKPRTVEPAALGIRKGE